MSLIFQKFFLIAMTGVVALPDTSGIALPENIFSWWHLLKTGAVLALVLALIWATLWAFKRVTGNKFANPSGLKVIGGIALGTRRSIQLVMIAEKLYVLGLTDSNISLIDKIDDPDEIAKILPSLSKASSGDLPFAKILQRIKNTNPTEKAE